MGELIGKAVYDAVKEAVFKQNGIISGRSIFQRLKERKINISELIPTGECECNANAYDLIVAFEEILLKSRYAGFIESAFTVSDGYERGLISDLTSFEFLCNGIAEEIAGKKIENMIDFIADEDSPRVLRVALNSLLNGLYFRTR
jgi:iron complex transport system substrate-binding protein